MIAVVWMFAWSRHRGLGRGAGRTNWVLLAVSIALPLCVLLADPAWGATVNFTQNPSHEASFTLFDGIVSDAKGTTDGWFAAITRLMRPTFLTLAAIEICWAATIWAFEKDNLNSLAVEIVKKFMFIGFFLMLLDQAPYWLPTIAETFEEVGTTVTSQPPITTDSIMATGLALINLLWSQAPSGFFAVVGKLGQIFVAVFVTIGILVAYVILAAQYFTLKIESFILFAAGAIFLGLGSSSWTKEYVSKYLNYMIGVGVRLLVLILVMSLMTEAMRSMTAGYAFNYGPLLKLLAVAILQTLLAIRAPEMAGALLSGGTGLSAGSASGAAGAATGGLKSVSGMAMGGLASAARVAQGASNLGKAVSAGRAAAQQKGKSGAAATVSGLSSAAGQVARQLPRQMLNGIKGKKGSGGTGGSGDASGQNPGVFHTAKRNLRQAAEGPAQGSGGGSSSSSSTSSFASAAGSSAAAGTSNSSGGNRSSSDSPEETSDKSSMADAMDDASYLDEVASVAGSVSTASSSPTLVDSLRPNKLRKATAPPRSQPPSPSQEI